MAKCVLCMACTPATGRRLDGTSELCSTLLCARTPQAVGGNALSLSYVIVHINSHRETCVEYDTQATGSWTERANFILLCCLCTLC